MRWETYKALARQGIERIKAPFNITGGEDSQDIRKKQRRLVYLVGGVGVFGAAYALDLFEGDGGPQSTSKQQKPIQKTVSELSTPLSPLKDGDIWVSRIEKLVKTSQQELEKVRSENLLLEKKLSTLMSAFEKGEGIVPKDSQAKEQSNPQAEEPAIKFTPPQAPPPFPSVKEEKTDLKEMNQFSGPSHEGGSSLGSLKRQARKKAKLLHLSNANTLDNSTKSPDAYLPAGTYFKVVTAMGVVVSTGTNASADPQPILLRIVDNGNLPGGLKGKVKDAVLIGTCYGSASAERAICRLKTLSWRDKTNNRTIEKPVEGWISSEDGVQGIRAHIIDRSSEIAREAFGAGLLSAASNFLKFEATSSVFPMSPFGQTNAMSGKNALQGAVGTGAGSALDKLAEFSIKRAESMSPVAYVASGRVLDAVLMRGVDLTPFSEEALKPINQSPESNSPQSGVDHP